jgi:catalase
MKLDTLTTSFGNPVADNQNSLTAGPRGPVLMQDYHLIEKMAHFNRERIAERVVHAKGYGAYGRFKVTGDIAALTRARLFGEVGKITSVFARFSTVGGESGSADTARDPRGFAVKFYTEEGNWDLVGNNTPVFFVRDPLKFSDLIHTQKRDPRTHLKPHWRKWDYWGRSPEAIHQVMMLYSTRGIPVSARFMHGFGSHTFSFWNLAGERHWVKFHWKCAQGVKNLTDAEAVRLAGENPDFSAQDFQAAIERAEFPRWRLCIQIMPEEEANHSRWHPFDLTKVWPHRDYPLLEVGELELNRLPENYFAEVEQAAFSPSNVVPGIGFSPDKVLQARVLSYADAQRHRLGVNHHQIPVNQALHATANHYHRDGLLRSDGNGGTAVDYEPNSAGGPIEDRSFLEPPLRLDGGAARFAFSGDDDDLYGQPRLLWRTLDDEGKRQLVDNLVASMGHEAMGIDEPQAIQQRMTEHWFRIHRELGAAVARGIGLCHLL